MINPGPVRGYLQRAFGAELGAAQVAMRTLSEAYSPEELADQAYGLYVEFRCAIEPGKGSSRVEQTGLTLGLDFQQTARTSSSEHEFSHVITRK